MRAQLEASAKANSHHENVTCVVCQALLEGISLCQPQPKLPSELIKYLGKTFCAWHIAIPLLESHVFLFPEACYTHHFLFTGKLSWIVLALTQPTSCMGVYWGRVAYRQRKCSASADFGRLYLW